MLIFFTCLQPNHNQRYFKVSFWTESSCGKSGTYRVIMYSFVPLPLFCLFGSVTCSVTSFNRSSGDRDLETTWPEVYLHHGDARFSSEKLCTNTEQNLQVCSSDLIWVRYKMLLVLWRSTMTRPYTPWGTEWLFLAVYKSLWIINYSRDTWTLVAAGVNQQRGVSGKEKKGRTEIRSDNMTWFMSRQ